MCRIRELWEIREPNNQDHLDSKIKENSLIYIFKVVFFAGNEISTKIMFKSEYYTVNKYIYYNSLLSL